jgi:hypothetical protein
LRFVNRGSAFPPLAEDGESIDHVLIVSVYMPRLGG